MRHMTRAALLPILALSLASSFLLSGCAGDAIFEAPSPAQHGQSIQGVFHGGQQPVSGAHVYMFAANTTGYGQPSISLLNASATGHSDSIGAYTPTTRNGEFTIDGAYTCSPNSQVYLLALGGDPGAGENSASGLMALLGNCPTAGNFDGSLPYINANEVSTVAAAYAISGYATDALHVSSSGTPLALKGIANAFAKVNNLVSLASGHALSTTPAGNGTVPQATLNTLGNILAACVNSTGPNSANCSTLTSNALSNGATGTVPTDTATAAINMAHNPGMNVANLYFLPTPAAPFAPTLSTQPNDLTLAVVYTGGGIDGPSSVAVDSSGNIWMSSLNSNSVNELTSNGTPLSPAAGFTDPSTAPVSVAIDQNDNAWVANAQTSSVTEVSTFGDALSPIPQGFVGGGLSSPQGIAIASNGHPWVASFNNAVSQFDPSGNPLSPSYGYTGGGLNGPAGIAIDTTGAVWVPNNSTSGIAGVTKFDASGNPLSPATGFVDGGISQAAAIAIDSDGSAWVAGFATSSVFRLNPDGTAISPQGGYTSGGINTPFAIAIDGAGSAWITDYFGNSVSTISSSGAAISPSNGFMAGTLNSPQSIAIDPSGSVWIANTAGASVTELIGAAVPVVTPISIGVKNHTLGSRP